MVSEQHDCGVLAYFVTQVTLNPLGMCLWKCNVSAIGDTEFCKDIACPKQFSATLDYVVNQNLAGDGSQVSPNIRTMHQMAFEFRADGFNRFSVRITNEYKVVALNAVEIENADAAFEFAGLHDQSALQLPDVAEDDDDDPRVEMVNQCMSILKSIDGAVEPERKQNSANSSSTRIPSDEPRAKHSKQRKGKDKVPTAASNSKNDPGQAVVFRMLLPACCMLMTVGLIGTLAISFFICH